MIKLIKTLLVLSFLISNFKVNLAAQSAIPNGCGSGWNAYLVPDEIKILGCTFKSSCDSHDICYSKCIEPVPVTSKNLCEYKRCLPKGDLSGTATCETFAFSTLKIESLTRKGICDQKFGIDLAFNNKNKPACNLFLSLYPYAVSILGKSSFLGGDDLGVVAVSDVEKKEFALAINSLYSSWSESQIVKFDSDIRSGLILIDLSKPIRFDNKKGLFNP